MALNGILVTEVWGLEPERDETRHAFSSAQGLRRFLRDTSIRFADHLAHLRHEFPSHDLNHLGPDYLGVGYALTVRNPEGKELHIGVSPTHWALVGLEGDPPGCDGEAGPDQKLVFYFGDWTEFRASETYRPQSAWALIERWLAAGKTH